MSNTIDEKVVQMKFDNKNFEKNVQTTINTLDKLKEKLNLSGASKGLELVQRTANTISFANMESSLDSIEKRFSTFGIVGMTVIQNLTNSFMGLASKIANFSIGGIIDGGFRRATNLQNAKFQLQGLLKDEEAVAAVMKDVNYGVEDTAYTLDAAANVASQLVASGIEAGEGMKKALRGVSGVAAMTNSTYEEIGNVYTRVAGQGRVMATDLNSLAARGMNAAATIGNYLGKTEAQVREMVSKGKISFEIFADAMDDAFGEHAKEANRTMNGALSNIKAALAKIGAEYFEPIIKMDGPLVGLLNTIRIRINEIKADIIPFISELSATTSKFIDMVADKIKNNKSFSFNPFFKGLEDDNKTKIFDRSMENIREIAKKTGLSIDEVSNNIEKLNSRFLLFNSLKNIGSTLITIFKSIGKAFREVFPPSAEGTLFNILSGFNKLTTTLKNNVVENADKIANTFKGLFSILSIGIDIIKSVVKAIGHFIGSISHISIDILGATSAIGQWIVKLKDAVKKSDVFERVLYKISDIMGQLVGHTKDFIKKFGSTLGSTIKTVANTLVQAVGRIFSAIGNAISNGDASKFMDLFNKGLLALLLNKIRNFINYIMKGGTIFDKFKKTIGSIQNIAKSISGVLDTVRQSLVVWQEQLRVKTLMKIATAVGILALALTVLSDIPKDKLENGLSAITVLFIELMATLKILASGDFIDSSKKMSMAIGLAISISILAGALKKISDIQFGPMIQSVVALGIVMKMMTKALNSISTDGTKVIKGAAGIIAFGLAIKILASAVKDLSSIDLPGLAAGVIAVGVLIAALGIYTKKAGTDQAKMIGAGIGTIMLAAGIKILASAVKDLGSLNTESLANGLIAIGSLIGALGVYTKKAGTDQAKMISAGVGTVILAAGIKILASAVKDLAVLDTESLANGLISIIAIIAVLGFYVNKTKDVNIGSMLAMAVSLDLMAVGIKQIAKSFDIMKDIKTENIIAGAIALSAVMLVLTNVMKKLTGMSKMNNDSSNFKAFLESFSIIWQADAFKGMTDAVQNIAKAFKILNEINVEHMIVSLGTIVTTLYVLLNIMKSMKDQDPMALILSALALRILASSIKVISSVGLAGVAISLSAIAGVFVIVAVAMKMLEKHVKNMTKVAKGIASLAGSLALLGLSVGAIGLGLSTFITGLALSFAAFRLVNLESLCLGFIAIAGAFIAIGVAAKKMKTLEVPLYKLAGAMILLGLSVASVGVGIYLIVSAFATLGAVGKDGAESAGLALKALVKSILELIPEVVKQLGLACVELLKSLKNMMPLIGDVLIDLVATLVHVLIQSSSTIAFGLISMLLDTLNELNEYAPQIIDSLVDFIVTTLNKLSERLPEIIPAVINFLDNLMKCIMDAFRNLETDSVLKSAEGLSILLLTMVGVLNILKFLKFDKKDMNKSMLAFAELAGIVVILGAVLGAMAAFTSSPEALLTAAVGLSLVMLAMSGVLKIISSLGQIDIKNAAIAIGALAGMAIPLALFMLVLRGMSDVNNAIQNALALSILAAAMTGLVFLLNIIGASIMDTGIVGILVGIASLALMALALGGFVANLQGMSGVQNAIDNALALSILASVMTALLIPLTILGAIAIGTAGISAAATAIGIASLAAMALALGALVGVLQAMSGIPNAAENAMALTDMARKLTDMLLQLSLVAPLLIMVDVAIAGLVAIITGIGVLATVIGSLMEKYPQLQDFLNNGLPVLEQIALSIGTMLGNFVNGFMTGATANLGVIGQKLSEFAINALPFITIMQTVSSRLGEGVLQMGAALLALIGANILEAITRFYSGGKSFTRLGEELSIFALKALPFIAIMSTVDPSAMEGAHNLADAILALTASNLLNSIAGWITGNADMEEFANSLAPLGKGIKSFVEELGTFSDEQIPTIESACKAIKILGEVSDDLPKVGGIAQAFAGTVDFGGFIDAMPELAKGIVSFAENLGEFDDPMIKTIKAGCAAIKELAEVSNELPTIGGVAHYFSGETDLKKFAESLKDIGIGVREFVAELIKDNIINENSIDSVYMVTSLLYSIAAIKDVNVRDKGKEMEDLAACLTSMANRLTEMVKSFESITIEDIEKAANIVDMIIELANKVVEFNSEPLQEFGDRLSKLGTESINNFVDALNDKKPRENAEDAIKNILNAVIETIEKKQDDINNAFSNLTKTATEQLYTDELKQKIYNAGINFVEGFAKGIDDKVYLARDAGSRVGKEALEAAQKALDINSPSKETYKIGKFFDFGLVNGIKAFSDKVYDESYSIGNEAKKGLSHAISKVASIMETDMDMNPTIRPILDLSDVENGVGTLSSMFGNPSIGVMSNLNAISSGINTESQNGGEIVNAINKLRKDLGSVTSNTYNINGVTYDNGSEIQEAVGTLVRAARIERRM